MAKEKSLEFKYNKPVLKNPNIVLDREKIKLALSCILNNAIKFTDSGFVEISILESNNSLETKILDTGKGISSENIEYLFSMFHQVNKTLYEYTPGIGSGLYITKLIVEAHLGKINVESKLGIGSSFSIVIPNNITPTQRNQITSLGTD
jgi:signal transduction histidine kinase